jgi:hypothetical protein
MAELREIYTEWKKSQEGKAMTWEELDEAYKNGQLRAGRVPDSLAIAVERSSRGNRFMRWSIWQAVRGSYGFWFHQLPELDKELERGMGVDTDPMPEWERSEGFAALMQMAS